MTVIRYQSRQHGKSKSKNDFSIKSDERLKAKSQWMLRNSIENKQFNIREIYSAEFSFTFIFGIFKRTITYLQFTTKFNSRMYFFLLAAPNIIIFRIIIFELKFQINYFEVDSKAYSSIKRR
jgi:hypothetical protein